jgi:hypothetical protein
MTRSHIFLAASALLLSGCATSPPSRTLALAPELSHHVAVDVVLDGQRVGGGQGTWLEPGLVVTTLDAVNDVPPTSELVIRAGGDIRLPASLWTGGNLDDANVAFLFVHHPEKFGALRELPHQHLCESPVNAADPGHFDAPTPSLSGTPVAGPEGCVAGLLSVRDGEVVVVPLDALKLVARGLPAR